MYGTKIEDCSQAKLLGVTLDSKLSFKPHVNNKIAQAKRILMLCSSTIKKSWGPKPQYLRWLYVNVIQPFLLYGCHVWTKLLNDKAVLRNLGTLQNLGLKYIAPIRKSTPLAALEVIFDVAPLELTVKERSIMTFHRLKNLHDTECTWVSQQPSFRGHWKRIKELIDCEVTQSDSIPIFRDWNKPWTVLIGDGCDTTDDLCRIYTDGSVIQGKCGAGASIYLDGIPYLTISEKLSNHCNIFQCELRAIEACCEKLSRVENRKMSFMVDNQGCLLALDNIWTNSVSIEKTKTALKALASRGNKITLRYIKAHSGKIGNEQADCAAKKGAISKRSPNKTFLCSKAKIKEDFRTRIINEWQEKWYNIPPDRMRQTKCFLNGPDKKIWKMLRFKGKNDIGILIRFLTGHAYMLKHEMLINFGYEALEYKNINCRLCQEGIETPYHLVTECPCLNLFRKELFFEFTLPEGPVKQPMSKVLHFAKHNSIRTIEKSLQDKEMRMLFIE